MVGLFVASLAVLVTGGVVSTASHRRRRTRLKALRSSWGAGALAKSPLPLACKLFEIVDKGSLDGTFQLDDQTWNDLDMDAVFLKLDHCVSLPGSQVLFALLHDPLMDENRLHQRWQVIERFQRDADLREETGLALWPLQYQRAGRLVDLLWGSIPPVAALERIAPALALAALAVTVGVLSGVVPGVLLLGVFLLNTTVHFLQKRRTDSQPLAELAVFVAAVGRLSRVDLEAFGTTGAGVREGLGPARQIQRRLQALLLDDGLGLAQYLKIFLLVDVISYWAVFNVLTRHRGLLRRLFLAVGEVDAMRAAASYLSTRPVSCAPDHSCPRSDWAVRGLVHPLLDAPVPNDFSMGNGATLITGSNMSGKTTFLKTLGVNTVLAQVFHRALAGTYALPFLRVITSIGRADNLIEGRSYYLAEVESVQRIVTAARSEDPHLILLDEIFRGTNTAERVAAGFGVLLYLANGRHLVFVATHDSELVELLNGAYMPYHFSESVGENGLSFDYAIRPGPATRSNAIALLKMAGFPPQVIGSASGLMKRAKQPD